MGYGSWKVEDYVNYSTSMGRTLSTTNGIDGSRTVSKHTTLSSHYSAQDIFKETSINPKMSPNKVMRECLDTDAHPSTIPVILALDVTGSMGSGSSEIAKKLNPIMMNLYESISDVEFMIMAIGDLIFDDAPIQISQFESDTRIAEWLDKIYFERGGGWNVFESYTAAWYMGLHHTKLDCWNRNKKGIIITIGDELLNPFLPSDELAAVTGDVIPQSISTEELYKEAFKLFDIYHLSIDDKPTSYKYRGESIDRSFKKFLDDKHYKVVKLNELDSQIINIILNADTDMNFNDDGISMHEISW